MRAQIRVGNSDVCEAQLPGVLRQLGAQFGPERIIRVRQAVMGHAYARKMNDFLLVAFKYNKLEASIEVDYENMRAPSIQYMIPESPATRCLYTAAQTRELDRIAISRGDGTGFDLMGRAARVAFRLLRQRWPEARKIVISCGGGNNGGDGLVMAGLAAQQGLEVSVRRLFSPEKLKGEAAEAFQWALARGVRPVAADAALPEDVDLVVDALLGTGLAGPVRADYARELERLAGTGAPVLAIDIPSGLHADTGQQLGPVLRADATITFIGINRGLLTGQGPACTGDLYFDDLQVPASVHDAISSDWTLLVPANRAVDACLPTRCPASHKGHYGKVVCLGGNTGMGGALLLAAGAACRAGAGLVAAITRPEHVMAGLTRWPDVQFSGVARAEEALSRLEWADVVVIGPGLGQDDWAQSLLNAAIRSGKPLILDADALNLIAAGQVSPPMHSDWIATPHPGEAARLLGLSVAEVEANRFLALENLQGRFGGCWLLKGAGPMWIAGEDRGVAASAHAVLAKGGSGDVLSGMLGALRAQGLSPSDAVRAGLVMQQKTARSLERHAPVWACTASDQVDALARLNVIEAV
ncbi:MAG: NAD(P)H-hydrate dehydratase [Gammaproteobacteria bacterium]|nr:MAG: NAD(P)H-hydrate dehydratase [Gammaproteobacteria bacterium]